MFNWLNSVIDWLKTSNRWKHLVGGACVACATTLLFPHDIFIGLWGSFITASSLEFKDVQWGGSWDWIDWSLTILGGVLTIPLTLI